VFPLLCNKPSLSLGRGQYFWHTRAAIGQAAARAVAQRVHLAEHTLRRHRVPSNVQDDLAYPATVH